MDESIEKGQKRLELSTISVACPQLGTKTEESVSIEIRAMATITTQNIFVFEDPNIPEPQISETV